MSRPKPSLPKQRQPAGLPSVDSSKSFWHTEPSPLLLGHRSTRDLPKTVDVVIIGSGITGTSVAYHLLNESSRNAEKKLNVLMLEAREACWGATGRNGGHCQPIFFEHPNKPDIGRFELANFYALGQLINDKGIDCEFVAQPGVRAIYSETHLEISQQALEIIKTTAPDLAALMRFTTSKKELAELRIPTALGAIVTDVAARMWPYKFVCHILEELLTSTDLNGRFNLQTLTPVTNITPRAEGVEVHTDRGTIWTSKVVLATNAYTSHLLPKFADLIVPCRGQMSSLIPFPSISGENRLKTSLGFLGDGLDDYLIQRPTEGGGHLMFGGGRQHGKSMGVTDDSVVDPKTARYLRSRLVEAFQLPEGDPACTYCETRKIRCSGRIDAEAGRCTNCVRYDQNCLLWALPKNFGWPAMIVPEQIDHLSFLDDTTKMQYKKGLAALWAIINNNPVESDASKAVRTKIIMATVRIMGQVARKMESADVKMQATHMWSGIMGYSRDYLPWIGKVPDTPHTYIAAGFTGHGMPNTWLAGKAVAVQVAQSLNKVSEADAVHAAKEVTGLPEGYIVTQERIQAALGLADVESKDWAEIERELERSNADWFDQDDADISQTLDLMSIASLPKASSVATVRAECMSSTSHDGSPQAPDAVFPIGHPLS